MPARPCAGQEIEDLPQAKDPVKQDFFDLFRMFVIASRVPPKTVESFFREIEEKKRFLLKYKKTTEV